MLVSCSSLQNRQQRKRGLNNDCIFALCPTRPQLITTDFQRHEPLLVCITFWHYRRLILAGLRNCSEYLYRLFGLYLKRGSLLTLIPVRINHYEEQFEKKEKYAFLHSVRHKCSQIRLNSANTTNSTTIKIPASINIVTGDSTNFPLTFCCIF